MRKRSAQLLVVLVLLLTVGSAALAQKKVLDFLWFTDGIEGEVLKQIIADYEELHPDIEINIIEVPFQNLRTRLQTMIAGGTPPDLARLVNVGDFAPALLDLTPYLGLEYIEDFVPSTHRNVVIDGKLMAVPMDVTANGIIYNKDYFAQAGVEVPQTPEEAWTWEEFIDKLQIVVANSPARFGLAYDFTFHRWLTLLYQAGGQLFTDDWKAIAINSPAGERAIEYFVELHDKNIIPRSIWLGGENPNTLFRAGLTAAHWCGNWMLTNYRDNIDNFEWGVMYMPYEARRSSVLGGKYIATFKDAKYPEEAVEFIKYFTSQEVNARFCRDSLFISPRLDNAQLDYEFGAEMFEIFSNELAVSPPVAGSDWAHPFAGRIGDDFREIIVEALQHELTPREAVEEMERVGNAILEEYMN